VPTFYFHKAAKLAPAIDYVFSLGYAYHLDHDPQAAICGCARRVSAQSCGGDAHFILSAALAAAGHVTKPRAAGWRGDCHRHASCAKKTRTTDIVPRSLERLRRRRRNARARRAAGREASSATRTNWRSSIWIGRGGSSSRRTTVMRSSN
jgi:hypothetical protein